MNHGRSLLRTHRHTNRKPFLLNPQAYKADVSLLLQGKADSKDLDSVAALVRSKVCAGSHTRR